jgi:hypothetical protein
MERISQLENAVSDERNKRQQFQEELKKIQKDALFAVSRGGLTTGKGQGGAPGAAAGGKSSSEKR